MDFNTLGIIVLLVIIIMLLIYSKGYSEKFTNTGSLLPSLDPQLNNLMDHTGNMDPGPIKLVNSDGVVFGGYRHQIIRPFDSVTADPDPSSGCKWPCYSDKKFQKWCSEKNAIKYHGMRPIITPDEYNNNLKKMFEKMIDVNVQIPYDDLFEDIDIRVFCKETQKEMMSWLMKKIAETVNKMPEMQRNGPWGSENFHHSGAIMYQYVKGTESYIKVLFDLYNPQRSTSTWVVATIFIQKDNDNKSPKLVGMEFVNEGKLTEYTEPMNGYGPITGEELPSASSKYEPVINFMPLGVDNSPEGYKKWENEYMKNPNDVDWNYMNTLPVKKFNNKGFYSNDQNENITIEGGIPDSIKNLLKTTVKSCKNNQLSACEVPKFSGISKESPNFVSVDGSTKNLLSNPIVTYDLGTEISGRPVETPNGVVYV